MFIPPDESGTEETDGASPRARAWTPVLAAAGGALPLTQREREVMTLVASGLQSADIAERLFLSPETVKSHVHNAMSKLGSHTRAHAVAISLVTDEISWEIPQGWRTRRPATSPVRGIVPIVHNADDEVFSADLASPACPRAPHPRVSPPCRTGLGVQKETAMKRSLVAQAQAATRRGGSAGIALLAALGLTAFLAASAQAQSVPLGTADSFAVLAATTVTNTGPSVISGDLGLSPGTAVTGFPPGTVTAGTIHAADAVALQAQSDLTTAYNNAAGRPSTATVRADLAGRTLTPGSTRRHSLGLSGDLTLDAQGNPNAVFVFQAGSTLTAGSGSRVLLIGGAQACNVFWQVGSSATVGTGAAFAGNILALTSISLTTAATLNGRALARNGAVTLDTNTVTRSTCATPATTSPTTGTSPGTTTTTPARPGAGPGARTPNTPSFVSGPGNTTARLTVPPRSSGSPCVSRSFTAVVRGRHISRVDFRLDGRRVARVTRRVRGAFRARIRLSRGASTGRVTARVVFASGTNARPRTLLVPVRRCGSGSGRARVGPSPSFTG